MSTRQMVVKVVLLGTACIGCKTIGGGQSQAKDVGHEDQLRYEKATVYSGVDESGMPSVFFKQCALEGTANRDCTVKAGTQIQKQSLRDTYEPALPAQMRDKILGCLRAEKDFVLSIGGESRESGCTLTEAEVREAFAPFHWPVGASQGGGGGGGGPAGCPPNYVRVPASTAVGGNADFCVSKYEMKNDGSGQAISQPRYIPWLLSRAEAIGKCREIGADLISNAQWQAVARGIEQTSSNWSGNAIGSGSLNRGSFYSSEGAIEASADDNNPCVGTGASCSMASWNDSRRVHMLSNGGVVWDISGNADWEWVQDDDQGDWGLGSANDDYMSRITNNTARAAYGPRLSYSSSSRDDYGLGFGYLGFFRGGRLQDSWEGSAVLRGGDGVFAVMLGVNASNSLRGFRCVRQVQ